MPKLLNLIIKEIDGEKASLSVFKDSIKFTYGEEVYVFDLEGRPIFMYFDNILYERGLSGEIVVKKWLTFKPPKRYIRRMKDDKEKMYILRRTFDRIEYLLNFLKPSIPNALTIKLNKDKIKELLVEEKKFKKIYRPISILPPDQYLSLVFQPLEGCPYNKCSFCTFYRDREFRYKSLDEFDMHVRKVVNFLGKGILLRRKIFLADANALFADTELLLEYISTVKRYIDEENIEGFYSFSDYFTVYKSIEELKKLKRAGYKRVYIGLESGSNDVLKILAKPGPSSRAVELVKRLKQAGISVGVIILIGAGGKDFYEDHVRETVKTINSMPLDGRDIIYFSKLKVREGSEYHKLSVEYGLTELSEDEMNQQIDEIKNKINLKEPPIYAIYDIDETIY